MWRKQVKNVCSISWLSGNYQQNCHSALELFKAILIGLIPEYLLHVETEMFGIQSSSAVLYHAWAGFCGMCELTEAVCDSKWFEPVPTQSECSFVGQTPAELCLMTLKWLTCTSNLPGLPTPQSLGHPSWHCSVVLAPVLHRPSCKGYNSCLCLGWANTAWLHNCVRIQYWLPLSRG